MMTEKRKRSQNFSYDEKHKLIKMIEEYKYVILNKKTDGATNQAKNEAWLNLCNRFNSTGTMPRSRESLMKVWEKMKSESRVYKSLSKQSKTSSGSGPSLTKIDPILEQVSELIERGCTGFADVKNSDTYTMPEFTVPIINDEPMKIKIETGNWTTNNSENTASDVENVVDSIQSPSPQDIHSIPEWKRSRAVFKGNHGKAEVESNSCSRCNNINSKTKTAELLRVKLLQEELRFNRVLHKIQIKTARKELKIKTEIYNQLKGGTFNFKPFNI